MKMKRKTLAIPVILFLTALTSHAFAQRGGGMMGPGSGQGQGMMGGVRAGAWGKANPLRISHLKNRKHRAKAFIEEYLRRYLPEYKLEKKDDNKSP